MMSTIAIVRSRDERGINFPLVIEEASRKQMPKRMKTQSLIEDVPQLELLLLRFFAGRMFQYSRAAFGLHDVVRR